MPRTPDSKLFPNPAMNFTAGRYLPPSNNVAAQPSLFQRADPYARNQPFSVRQALGGTVPGAAPSTVANGAGQPQAQGQGTIPGDIPIQSQIQRILMEDAGLIPPATGAPESTSLDALLLMQKYQTEQEQGANTPIVGQSDLAAAAKLVLEGVQGNPFITPAGKKALASGAVPQFNQINPAFYRYTTPSVVQALMGLYPMTGLFGPEDPAFMANIFRPRGL